jgi:hypothetical protein
VGVLIDTEYLGSDAEERRQNPYYIVIEGVRYYGPTPEKVVETAREHPDVKGSVRGEAVFVRGSMKAPEQTALPANRGRTFKNRAAAGLQSMKNKAAAAAAGVKGRFQSKPAASGAAAAAASGPTMKNRAAAGWQSMKNKAAAAAAGVKGKFQSKQPTLGAAAAAPPAKAPEARFAGQQIPGEEETAGLLAPEGLQQGGRRRRRKTAKQRRQRR